MQRLQYSDPSSNVGNPKSNDVDEDPDLSSSNEPLPGSGSKL